MKHVDPREVERAAERERIRAKIEARIEKLIAKLDRMDGDPDLEPSNGGWQEADRNPATVDAETDAGDSPELDTADSEPWLGSVEGIRSQQAWASSNRDDREGVNEDGDPLDAGEIDDGEHDSDDVDREAEGFDGGYSDHVAATFRTPDVHKAAAEARSAVWRLQARRRAPMLHWRGGVPVIGEATA